MSFDVQADAYELFMGRYSAPLAERLVGTLGLTPGRPVLDVGAGPGTSTVAIVGAVGVSAVTAVDPSAAFVEALRDRLPGVRSELAGAERLPFTDEEFDASLAQLVVPFLSDPVAGLAELSRVTAPGGIVAATAWDVAGDRSPMSTFWRAAADVTGAANGDMGRPGVAAGELVALFRDAGLPGVAGGELSVSSDYRDLDDWWSTYERGVGPAGAYLGSVAEEEGAAIKARTAELLGPGTISVVGTAFTATARV